MASHNGQDYVEIGGIKWATMNIGASSVTDYGQYFQWGDTTGYLSGQCGSSGTTYAKPFNWADYKFGNGTASPDNSGLTKYNTSDTKAVLELSDDAARANWGGSWRMPTVGEYGALGNAVTTAWTNSYQGSGVSGLVCTDNTDSSKVLFFPACGYCYNGHIAYVSSGFYWPSSLRIQSNFALNTYLLYFNNDEVNWQYIYWGRYYRYYGFPVRGVVDE